MSSNKGTISRVGVYIPPNKRNQKIDINDFYSTNDFSEIIPPGPVTYSTATYAYPLMQQLRERLSNAKNQMDLLQYTSDEYDRLTSLIRPTTILSRRASELGAQYPTRAFIKYYEIANYLHKQHNISFEGIRAFFNAELPGAAICAINHYIRTITYPDGRVADYDWRASSLIGEDGALDDVFGIYKFNRDKWLMNGGTSTNESNNGDMTIVANILNIRDRLKDFHVNFYSHDAGINPRTNFNDQERMNMKLHLGCAIAGFVTLSPGGTFVAKQYTFYETLTVNLLQIYSTLFERFIVYKPISSGASNSEIYLIGINYKGIADELLDRLIHKLEQFDESPMLEIDSNPASNQCLSHIFLAAERLTDKQIAAINQSMILIRNKAQIDDKQSPLSKLIVTKKVEFANEFLRKNKMYKIDKRLLIRSNETVMGKSRGHS
jgi:hypothetical protein